MLWCHLVRLSWRCLVRLSCEAILWGYREAILRLSCEAILWELEAILCGCLVRLPWATMRGYLLRQFCDATLGLSCEPTLWHYLVRLYCETIFWSYLVRLFCEGILMLSWGEAICYPVRLSCGAILRQSRGYLARLYCETILWGYLVTLSWGHLVRLYCEAISLLDSQLGSLLGLFNSLDSLDSFTR